MPDTPPLPPDFAPEGSQPGSQSTVGSGPPPPGFTPEGSDQPDPTIDLLKDQKKSEPPPTGFVNTLTSDIGKGLSGLKDSAERAAGYIGGQLGIGQPVTTPEEEQNLYKAQDEHKAQVYQKVKEDIHAGRWSSAAGDFAQLFDPKYDDPNDPLAQMAQAQWDSSKMAKARMEQAGKDGDWKGVIQHAAGILPIASQVDDAMERYSKDRSRENLAHVVSAALPAFIPSLFRGAKALRETNLANQVASNIKTALPPEIPAAIDAVKSKFGGASHVYDPTSGEVTPVEQVGEQAAPRQAIGEAVQQAADTVQTKLGQDVGAAKARAAAVPLPGTTSVDFMQDMIKVADEVDKHLVDSKALGPGGMGKVKDLVDEISGRTLGQKEFEGYAKRIDSEITKTETPGGDAQVGRMYTKVKDALKKEYYNQIALSDPATAEALQKANSAYAEITGRLERGPARRAFGADSPEAIAKQVQSGAITETKADAIMQTLKEADQLSPRAGSYVKDFRRSVLYQQAMKYATKMRGVVVRMDSAKMLEELDKNPTFRHVYGDDYNSIYEAVKADAKKQAFQQTAKTVGKGVAIGGLALAAKQHIIHLLGGLIGGQ